MKQTTVTQEIKKDSRLRRFLQLTFTTVDSLAVATSHQLKSAERYQSESENSSRVASAVEFRIRLGLGKFEFRESSAFKAAILLAQREPDSRQAKFCLELAFNFSQKLAEVINSGDEEALARHCLVLSELETAFRTRGAFFKYQSLAEIFELPLSEVNDVIELACLARDSLTEFANEKAVDNPTFGNRLIGGDGDFLLGQCLVDVKVLKSTPQPDHIKKFFWQVLTYVLLDYNNKYKIAELGLLLPRQSSFFRFELERDFLEGRKLSQIRNMFYKELEEMAQTDLGWSSDDVFLWRDSKFTSRIKSR